MAQRSERDVVQDWLRKSDVTTREAPRVPRNTPDEPCTEYRPPSDARYAHQQFDAGRRRDVTFDKTHDAVPTQEKSDSAVISRVLRENRLPKPKVLSFDGDPKQYKMFIASFQSNVEEMLDKGDDKLKLTLVLQHCTGKALAMIDDCVMLPPNEGYNKAIEKLEKRFGKTHKIAQSYIEGVVKGGKLKLNDVDALVQLADDMEKCQTILSQLRFASDLDSTGTLRSIVARLPDCLQMQWVKRSYKILDRGTEAEVPRPYYVC